MIDLLVMLAMFVATHGMAPRPLPDILPPLAAQDCAPAFMCGPYGL
jgi:hypothetical protein